MLKDMRMLACMLFATLPALADWVAIYQMGAALLDEGRPHEAIRELKRALEQRPDHAAILDALGRAEFRAGQYGLARNYFERALEVAAGDTTASRANLAQACLAMGNHARAEQLLRRIVESDPENGVAWGLLGQTLYKMRRYAEADTALHKALALRNDPLTWSDLAALYQSQHKEAQALELLRQALLEAPPGQGRARIRANLGVLEWKTGARADSEVSLREALDETVTAVGPNHPDTAWVLENYSQVLRKSGRKAEARNAEARATRIRTAFAAQNNHHGLTVDWRDQVPEGLSKRRP